MILVAVSLSVLAGTLMLPADCQNTSRLRVRNYGESAILTCTARDDVTFDHWLLPDVTTVISTSRGGGGVELLANRSLYIADVQEHHLGDYLCRVTENNDRPLYFKTRLYRYSPPVWELYRRNFIIGGGAAAALLTFFALVCAINGCRYSVRHQNGNYKRDVEMTSYDADIVGLESSVTSLRSSVYRPAKYLAPDGTLLTNL